MFNKFRHFQALKRRRAEQVLVIQRRCATQLDQVDDVLRKAEECGLFVILFALVSDTTGQSDEENISNEFLSFLVEYNLDSVVIVTKGRVHFFQVVDKLYFLNVEKNAQNGGRLSVIFCYLGTDTSFFASLVSDSVHKLSEKHSSIPILSYFPNVLYSELIPAQNFPESILILDKKKIEEYKLVNTTHSKVLLQLFSYFCNTTVLWIMASTGENRNFSWIKSHGNRLVKAEKEADALSYLSQNYFMQHSSRFRILISFDGNSSALSKCIKRIRNKFSHTPILVYNKTSKIHNDIIYDWPRVEATQNLPEVLLYCQMCPLVWAPCLRSFGHQNYSDARRFSVTLLDMYCTGLAPKDSNGLSDPYVTVLVGQRKEKTSTLPKTLNAQWCDLGWQFVVSPNEQFSFQVWDKDDYGKDYEGEVSFNIMSLLPELPVGFEKTYFMKSWKLLNLSGVKTIVTGFLTLYFQINTIFEEEEVLRRKRHFGQPLPVSLNNARDEGGLHLTDGILNQLMSHGTKTEGLFRIPGNKEQIDRVRVEIDSGKNPDWSLIHPYDLAGLLKNFLSELPESLVPYKVYQNIKDFNVDSGDLDAFKKHFKCIPPENLELLNKCCKLFEELIKNTEITFMNPENIGTSIGPSILLSQKIRNDPMAFVRASCVVPFILAYIIQHRRDIFEI
eukprot:TRINITY_DN20089_c0_g1_i2.p1 TRINITY_DN20089_c0_g1~~TRINITY_DN20089_c0_g1_i2.p1  ORF type:complete len:672 (+),score=111.04 TRINITY_DN20089_c0_g1_i2:154-2169(+)